MAMEHRITALEGWARGHDEICALRYSDLKAIVTWLVRGVFALLLAIVAWLAIQLWNGSQERLHALEAAQSRVSTPPAAASGARP